ncbi:MAG: MBOAT family protein [Bacteroidia bacterium]|nr:MBOAT family protein [Bacteroidia bacterium]
MLFNSLDFGFFLVIVFTMYWLIGGKRRITQNLLILIASYVFYGFWDWRFLTLLIGSSLIDYIAAKFIHATQREGRRKFWLLFSLFWNLGILFTFKYMNFFLDSFHALFSSELLPGEFSIWNVIIPVGLSFYTFQTMSYSIDVYRGKLKPTNNLLNFLCYVSFFPQLVAGPIERASFLLPQFEKERSFDLEDAREGLRQILWGLFKKILVADKLGIAVTMVFDNPEGYGSITLIYAAVLFSFQVYCDFSGYTDIAIGTARLFGFKLHINFRIPYLAKSMTQFWQRWHITLTKWFTDYVYLPIVKSYKKPGNWSRVWALLITMSLVGLWHGANWTFICFGVVNGLMLVMERIPLGNSKRTLARILPTRSRWITVIYFFALTSISSVFFRAYHIDDAWIILKRIFTLTADNELSLLIGVKISFLILLIVSELLTRHKEFPLQQLEKRFSRPIRWGIYYVLVVLIIRFYEPLKTFIYFQF